MVIIRRNLMPDAPEGGSGAGATAGGAGAGQEQNNGGQGQQLDEQTIKKETEELQGLISKDVTTLNDAEKARLTELQGRYDITETDEEGNPLTPERKKELLELQKKLDAIYAKDPKTWTDAEKKFIEDNNKEKYDPKKVYEEVEQLTGLQLDVDYGEVDPVSAEGIAKREQTIFKTAQEAYEEELKEKFPRAYQFISHLAMGGKEEDFFKETNRDWKTIQLSKDNKTQQEEILRSALRIKGNTLDQIDALVKYYKDGGTLYEAAERELKANTEAQKLREQQDAIRRAEIKRKEEQDIANLSKAVLDSLDKGFDGIKLSPVDRDKFRSFLGQRLEYVDGQYLMVRPVDIKDLAKELKYEFFQFKNGDLTEYVARTAKSQNTQKVRQLIKAQITPKSSAGSGSQGKRTVTSIKDL